MRERNEVERGEMGEGRAPAFRSWSDEDGNCWMRGHIDPAEFIADCVRMEDYTLGLPGVDHDADSFWTHRMEAEDVDHIWLLPVDPEDEETAYEECGPGGAPGAEAFTVWYA